MLFTRYQIFVILILTFLQFSVILDFMILLPLGAMVMPALKMTPLQFSTVVSVYAFSAGASGFLAAGFADRYDRKNLLLFFYFGFIAGTFLCGIAQSYEMLLFARFITGSFGGVLGAIVFAISADLFPFEKQGRVTGFLQSAFAGSQILGLPIGLYLSNIWGWHAPFFMIAGICCIVSVFILVWLRPINEHLKMRKIARPFEHLFATLINRKYILAFFSTSLLVLGGYMLLPFSSAFTVNNLGINIKSLPLIYFITGLSAIIVTPLIGQACDRFGKYNIFILGTVLSVLTVFIYTHLGKTPLVYVILINMLMFLGIFSRVVPCQALMTAIPTPGSRGSFMAINSSLQQIFGGFATILAGSIVIQDTNGFLINLNIVGYVLICTSAITVILMYFINRMVKTAGTPENHNNTLE